MPNSRHSTAIFSPSSSRAMNFSRSSIGLHSFQGTFALLAKSPMCNPCARNELSPISQEGHLSLCRTSVCRKYYRYFSRLPPERRSLSNQICPDFAVVDEFWPVVSGRQFSISEIYSPRLGSHLAETG